MTAASPGAPRRTLIIVGAFPAPGVESLGGGVLTSCRALLAAGIGERFSLRLVDSSQSLSSRSGVTSQLTPSRRVA